MTNKHSAAALTLALLVFAGACHKSKPPIARPTPPPMPSPTTNVPPPPAPAPPAPVPDTTPIPKEPPITEDPIGTADLDTINKNSPFQPVFYALDSYEVDATAQQALTANAGDPEEVSGLGHHDRRALRRARHGGIQPGAR